MKLVTLTPGNAERDLPFINAVYVLFDAGTQAPDAIVDGAALTALRTAAVCGPGHAPARATPDAGRLVDLRRRRAGALAPGGDARRPPDRRVTVVSRTPARAQALAEVGSRRRCRRGHRRSGRRRRRGHRLHVHDERRAAVRRSAARAGRARQRRGQLQPDDARARHASRWRAAGWWWRRATRRSPRPGSCCIPIDEGAFGRDHVRRRPRAGRARRRGPDVARTTSRVFKSVGMAFEDLIVARAAVDAPRTRMTTTADVVVVGGGVVGASTAYHLAAAGVEHVVLLERADSVATGSTGACAGGFRHQFSSRDQHRAVARERADDPRVHGGARAAARRRAGRLPLPRPRRAATGPTSGAGAELQRSLGVDTQLLTPDEAAAVAPGIAIDDVVGASFCAARRHRRSRPGSRRGTRRSPDVPAPTCGWASRSSRSRRTVRVVTGVRTEDGSISAPVVVNAAGPWAGTLAATAGIRPSTGTHPTHGRDDGRVPRARPRAGPS